MRKGQTKHPFVGRVDITPYIINVQMVKASEYITVNEDIVIIVDLPTLYFTSQHIREVTLTS